MNPTSKRGRTIDAFFPKQNPKKVQTAAIADDGANAEAGPSSAASAGAARKRRRSGGAAGAAGDAGDAAAGAAAGAAAAAMAGEAVAAQAPSAEVGAEGAAAAAAAAAGPSSAGPAAAEQQQEGQQQEQAAAVQAAPAAAAPAAPAAPAGGDGLTPAQRAEAAARNREAARLAVEAAAAPGAPPLALAALLVEATWAAALGEELRGANVRQLEAFLHTEWRGAKPVFPPRECIFAAFNACPFDQVRVVILGQDPYHGPGQAMGLSFSVPRDVRPLPPSLLNIYKEAAEDLGWPDRPAHGDLSSWSVQGVLLLNTCLTVRRGEANSHSKKGWEAFTDAAISALSRQRKGVVFLLWGNPAQAKAKLIDGNRHHVLKAAHPSPLSASRGFFGCRHFSQANALLARQRLPPIQWRPE